MTSRPSISLGIRLTGLLALLAFGLQGFQWELRQAVAWAGMAVSYSQDADLGTALRQTFSGERPCSQCTSITQTRVRQDETPSVNAPPEMPDPLSAPPPGFPLCFSPPPSPHRITPCAGMELSASRLRPPTPPPRSNFS